MEDRRIPGRTDFQFDRAVFRITADQPVIRIVVVPYSIATGGQTRLSHNLWHERSGYL